MKKYNLYTGATIGLMITACVTYYITNLTAANNRDKGFLVTYYSPPTCVDPDYLEKLRTYQTYSLTSDTIANGLTIAAMRTYLNGLKKNGDSLNGVHVIISNDTPYTYYLKSIAVFNELSPRHFFPVENHLYAISNSRYQVTQDSINQIGNERNGIEIIGTE